MCLMTKSTNGARTSESPFKKMKNMIKIRINTTISCNDKIKKTRVIGRESK